ncbi:MAG: Asp23/Gls24 family envelope stress response protein [Lachnospiraceae bacterium]|nr:Asp23/Gls24 family envelope stress response protein [Lachnospiraceae bacterium]
MARNRKPVEEKNPKIVTLEANTEGEVKIADDVVASIAALAANEVEGLDDMVDNIGSMLMNTVGVKQAGRGVRVDVVDGMVRADLAIMLKYGYSIRDTGKKIQEKVKASIENMTGLTVTDVNIHVVGVNTESRNES